MSNFPNNGYIFGGGCLLGTVGSIIGNPRGIIGPIGTIGTQGEDGIYLSYSLNLEDKKYFKENIKENLNNIENSRLHIERLLNTLNKRSCDFKNKKIEKYNNSNYRILESIIEKMNTEIRNIDNCLFNIECQKDNIINYHNKNKTQEKWEARCLKRTISNGKNKKRNRL